MDFLVEHVAIQCACFIVLNLIVFHSLMWIITTFSGIRIEEFGLFFFGKVLNFKVENIQLVMGLLPLGAYLRLCGITDESISMDTAPQPYEFRSKSWPVRLLTVMASPISLLILGCFLLNAYAPLPLSETLSIYLKTSTFIISMEEGNILWNAIFSSPLCLLGFISMLFGLSNLLTNSSMLIPEQHQLLKKTSAFLSFSAIFFLFGVIRLVWVNSSWMSWLYFLLAAWASGIIGILIFTLWAKVLPKS